MKFGAKLRREAIPEWRSQYIDYESLKRILKVIPYTVKSIRGIRYISCKPYELTMSCIFRFDNDGDHR